MSTSTARVPTANGQKYMTQLAKHWSHRFPDLTYDEHRADVPMPGAPLVMLADEQGLTLTLKGDAEALQWIQGVVTEHLGRFAFRESLTFNWQQSQATG